MRYLLLFSYALLPKSRYPSKEIEFNESLDADYSLTGLSILETYSGNLIYKKGDIDKVLVLGCHTFGKSAPADSELMARYLEKLGVPGKNIILDTNGTNTAYQVSKAKDIVSNFGGEVKTLGVALACHTNRTSKLLSAYGVDAQMISVEEVLGRNDSQVPDEISDLLSIYKGSQTENKLIFEAKILELMQIVDPKGELQKIVTNLRGIRYFDVDIPSTIAKSIK